MKLDEDKPGQGDLPALTQVQQHIARILKAVLCVSKYAGGHITYEDLAGILGLDMQKLRLEVEGLIHRGALKLDLDPKRIVPGDRFEHWLSK